MGLFSFLSGNGTKDGGASVVETSAERPASVTSTPAVDAEVPTVAGTMPAGREGWDLDTGALTAPPTPRPEAVVVGPADPALTAAMQAPIIDVIKTVYDPEIPVDVYELGLIYDIIVDAQKQVLIKMTLTSPACPSAQQLPSEVRYKVKAIPEVTEAVVEIVWDPPWDKDRMSEAAKLQLGFF